MNDSDDTSLDEVRNQIAAHENSCRTLGLTEVADRSEVFDGSVRLPLQDRGAEIDIASIENLRRQFLAIASAGTWSTLALHVYLTIGLTMKAGGTWIDGLDWSFSYFTNLTNILVAIVFTSLLVDWRRARFFSRSRTVAAVMLYIMVVGMICLPSLLSSRDAHGLEFFTLLWLHVMTPILVGLYWVFFVPKGEIRPRDPIIWLIYPAAYFVYILARGALSGRYPYSFVDPHVLGFGVVLINVSAISAIFVTLGFALTVVDRLPGLRRITWAYPSETKARPPDGTALATGTAIFVPTGQWR